MARLLGAILIALCATGAVAVLNFGPMIAGQGCAFGSATGCSGPGGIALLAMFVGLPLVVLIGGVALGARLWRRGR